MPTVKAKSLTSALERKGFALVEGDHHYYYLYVDGKRTDIRTKASHGKKEISAKLLSQIRRQMGALTNAEISDFIECPMSEEAYVALLTHHEVLPEPKTNYRSPWLRRVHQDPPADGAGE